MRRFLAAAAAGSVVFAAASAQAASHRLTLSVTGYSVPYGHQVTVAGRFTNGRAGERVTIFARPYGATAATPVATVVTRVGGSFRYFAHPKILTSYTAQLGAMRSRTLTVGVRPLVTGRELTNGEVQVHVQAARSFRGRLVKLQQQQADASWKTVVQRPLGGNSSVILAPTLASSYLRVAMSVNEAGKGYLGGFSHYFLYHSYQLTLRPTSLSVVYGKSVELAGHLVSGKPDQPIEIWASSFGRSPATHLATATTSAGGWWKVRVSPQILTTYHATWSGTEQSPQMAIDVKPLITARELSNGQIRAHVQAAKSFRGRLVKLQQQQAGGVWETVGKAPLDGSSSVVFAPASVNARLRVAMSVNEAGKGYLGGFSHPFQYHQR